MVIRIVEHLKSVNPGECCEPLILFTYILVDIERHVTLTYCIVVTSVLTRDIFLYAFATIVIFCFSDQYKTKLTSFSFVIRAIYYKAPHN
jgi:hypothetical protein